jgi:hypothetical protein
MNMNTQASKTESGSAVVVEVKDEEKVLCKDGSVNKRYGAKKTNDPAAPWGFCKDGVTPRKQPGRKKTS